MDFPPLSISPFRAIAAALLSCLLLAGCGQKGELYIPSGDGDTPAQQPDKG